MKTETKNRILLRTTARELTLAELTLIAGGAGPGKSATGSMSDVSCAPNGPDRGCDD
jgi:hypothetical protein